MVTSDSEVLAELSDPERLEALEDSGVLEGLDGRGFDRYTRLAQRSLDVPVALVNFLDDRRQMYRSGVGLPAELERSREAPLSHSYCKYVVAQEEPLIVRDAREHPLLKDNPAIEDYDAIGYVGFPLITREGHALGTFCVITHEPRDWTDEEIEQIRDLADGATTEVWLRQDIRRRQKLEEELAERVDDRTEHLREAQNEILSRLAAAAEYRDDETGRHIRRVGALSARLSARLGRDERWTGLLRKAATLHDVGKVAIPDAVLLKEGPLTDAETRVMRRHTVIGAKLLSDGNSELVRLAETVAHSHHERWDGSGYPRGLKGEVIPLAGRIVAVADAFDAMTHDRPYRQALAVGEALQEIEDEAGSHFDPQVVEALLEDETPALEEVRQVSRMPH